MLLSEDIKKIVIDNYMQLIGESFPQLNHTHIGAPIPVFDQHKDQKYWFIPFLLKSKVRGSAIIDINGKMLSYGILTPNRRDENKLIDISYFESVPDNSLTEVRNFYPDFEIVSYFFSFDKTPAKWGWLLQLKKNIAGDSIQVFVGPEGWYEKKMGNDVEG